MRRRLAVRPANITSTMARTMSQSRGERFTMSPCLPEVTGLVDVVLAAIRIKCDDFKSGRRDVDLGAGE